MQTFEKYLNERGYREASIRSYQISLAHFTAWSQDTERADYNEILGYIEACRSSGNNARTIAYKLNGLKHYYTYLIDQKRRSDHPLLELHIRRQARKIPHALLSMKQLEDIYNLYPGAGIVGKRNKAVLGLIVYQGLSTGELAAIEVKDLLLEEGKIYVPSVGRSNSRILKLEAAQIMQLQNYLIMVRPVILAMNGKATDKLFMSSGQSIRFNNTMVSMIRLVRKQNDTVRDTHQIRASLITEWLKQYNIRQVQYMTGHRYVSSTGHYRTDKLEGLQEQLESLHPLK